MNYIRRRKQTKNNLGFITNIALIFIIAALALVLYRVIGLFNQMKGEIKIDNLYNVATPIVTNENVQPMLTDVANEIAAEPFSILPQFTSLCNENSDTVGWLMLDDTRIDHVVVQGENNVYYLEHDFFGNKSASAAMMMDMQCDIQKMQYHFVIYGHRMKSGTMMNDILKYEDEEYFFANSIIHFDTIYETMEWQVFSTYCTDYNYDNTRIVFGNDVEWLNYMQKLKDKSIYQNDVMLEIDDVVLTLYTCDYRIAGGRYVLHARLIKDE